MAKKTESRDALVIGINQYNNLPSLKTPANDAEAIARFLETYGNFNVKRLPLTTRGGILQTTTIPCLSNW